MFQRPGDSRGVSQICKRKHTERELSYRSSLPSLTRQSVVTPNHPVLHGLHNIRQGDHYTDPHPPSGRTGRTQPQSAPLDSKSLIACSFVFQQPGDRRGASQICTRKHSAVQCSAVIPNQPVLHRLHNIRQGDHYTDSPTPLRYFCLFVCFCFSVFVCCCFVLFCLFVFCVCVCFLFLFFVFVLVFFFFFGGGGRGGGGVQSDTCMTPTSLEPRDPRPLEMDAFTA